MNKKLLLLPLLTFTVLFAETIQLSPEQAENWQIKIGTPQSSQKLPLGEFITEVVTPPSLLHTISLPFEANVKKLNVAKYQKVTKGLILAEVTGTEWIALQQQAIANATELQYYSHLAKRKRLLCKEQVIPQKECIAADAQLETYKLKVAASKALLKSYGAHDEMIKKLFNDLTLSQTMRIASSVSGHIVELNATPGKSTSPSDALFIIQEQGALWLESNLESKLTAHLHEGQKIQITLGNKTIDTTILQIAPVINAINQTRQIRFAMPSDASLSTGLRSSAQFSILKESLKVEKTSVIKHGDSQIVFVKTKDGFSTEAINILAEDNTHYFIESSDGLQKNIAINSLAILKNMLGGDDE